MKIDEHIRVQMISLNRKGLSVREIARRFNVSWATAYKYINEKSAISEVPRHRTKTSRVYKYKDEIIRLLERNASLGKQRLTEKRIYQTLVEEHGSDVNFSKRSLERFIKSLRLDIPKVASVPLEHRAGSVQIDFGSARYKMKEFEIDGKFFVMTFPYSGVSFAVLLPSENQQCLFYAMNYLFKKIGGTPTAVRFDNASSIVDRGGGYRINQYFENFATYYGFKCERCNPSKGNEKGSVERAVSTIRQNFLSPPPVINDLNAFNDDLFEKCRTLIVGKRYGTDCLKSELFIEDCECLLKLPSIMYEPKRTDVRTTDKRALVQFDKHLYSTRSDLPCSIVTIEYSAFSIDIYDKSGNFVAHHERCYTGEMTVDVMAYIDSFVSNPRSLAGSGFFSEEFSMKVAEAPKQNRKKMILDEIFKTTDTIQLEEERKRHERYKTIFGYK